MKTWALQVQYNLCNNVVDDNTFYTDYCDRISYF